MFGQTRRQLFVDSQVQGTLLLRAALYWIFCLLTVAVLLLAWRMLTNPALPLAENLQSMWFDFAPALVISLLMLPIVAIDLMRFSNRFVGPIYRLRRSMRQLADGEPVAPVNFRDGDYWSDLGRDFNRLLTETPTHGDLAGPPEESEAPETTECDAPEVRELAAIS